jgi:proteasome activator subunit 4
MTELNDNPELQTHSQAVLYIISAVTPPSEYIDPIVTAFVDTIKSSKVMKSRCRSPYPVLMLIIQSWRIRLHTMRPLIVFFYRNLLAIGEQTVMRIMDMLLDCLSDDNVEVREMASKTLSGIVRVSQRQSIAPLLVRIVYLVSS